MGVPIMTTRFPDLSLPRLFAAIGASIALVACAHPDNLRVGMTREELDARFGTPSVERHEGNDEIRIYTSQPLGQRASAAHIAADGHVTAVEPLLNTQHFAAIGVDAWNKGDVFAHFGKPAEVSATRNFVVWTYRYREAEAWNSLFNIMFDGQGVVRQTQNEPDPLFDPAAIKGRN